VSPAGFHPTPRVGEAATLSGAARGLRRRVPVTARRPVRSALIRYARAEPRADAAPRVLIVLTSAWGMGGTIRAAINLAGHLAQRYEVEILSVVRRRQKPFFPVAPGVRLTALDDLRPRALAWAPRQLHRLLRKLPSALMDRCEPSFRHWSLWVDIMVARKLHAQRGFLITTRAGLNLVAADVSPPGLITIGLEQMHFGAHTAPVLAAMKERYARLDALVVLTAEDEQRYAEFLSPPPRLAHIPNTVYAGERGTANLDAPTILAAGRLTRQKGFDMLVDAFCQVVPHHPRWRLRICGRGSLRPELQAQIVRLGLADVVTLAGAAKDLGAEMTNASIFVLSSRTEGFPLVLVEAMSHGMAVVAFDCPTGPRDVIDDHRNGILVPPRDIDALARGLREMIGNPELRRRCGTAARETGRAYTVDAIGPRWESLFRQLEVDTAKIAAGAQVGNSSKRTRS
jgi:glycosyltransferase involved in cell wall biosynthesis